MFERVRMMWELVIGNLFVCCQKKNRFGETLQFDTFDSIRDHESIWQSKCKRSECLHWWCQVNGGDFVYNLPFCFPPMHMCYNLVQFHLSVNTIRLKVFCLPWLFLCAMSAMPILMFVYWIAFCGCSPFRGGRQFRGKPMFLNNSSGDDRTARLWALAGPYPWIMCQWIMCMPPSSSRMDGTCLVYLLFHNSKQRFKSEKFPFYTLTSNCKPFSSLSWAWHYQKHQQPTAWQQIACYIYFAHLG